MPDVNRRRLLRDCGAGLSALSVAALSGCNALAGDSNDTADGDDGNGGPQSDSPGTSDGRDSGDGSDDAQTQTLGSGDGSGGGTDTGPTVRSTVDGLAVENAEVVDDADRFSVDVGLRNAGDQATDPFNYGYHLTVFDESGADITGDVGGLETAESVQLEPGETVTMTKRTDVDGDREAVARYELVVRCSERFDEGVYCDE